MEKINYPIGSTKAAKILNRPIRTIQYHLKKLNANRLGNQLSAFTIRNQAEFNRLKNSIKNAYPGNPNFKNHKGNP